MSIAGSASDRGAERGRSRAKKRPDADVPPGLLLVDKPGGMTSHDVVARARRVLSVRKVGHAGTLDPMATGLLILGVGLLRTHPVTVTGALSQRSPATRASTPTSRNPMNRHSPVQTPASPQSSGPASRDRGRNPRTADPIVTVRR